MKFFLAAFAAIFFFVSLLSLAFAQTFPKPTGYVNDFAGLYSSTFRTQLEKQLASFESSTSAEIVVVTVPNLQGTTIEDYAVRLFEDWKIGKKQKDNGILLLIAKDERNVRIEVGYGLESVVNDARAGRIIRDEIIPAFKNNDYEGGTQQGVTILEKYVRGESVVEKPSQQSPPDWSDMLDFLPVIFFGFIYLGSFLARSKDYYAGGIIGGIVGLVIGIFIGELAAILFSAFVLAMIGLALDYILSANYHRLKAQNKSTDWWGSRGGFYGGGGRSSGGGFGGFGGGSSGGGGASGRW